MAEPPSEAGVSLRPFEPADLDALADLWVESWRATMADIDFARRRPWLVERLGQLHARGVLVIVASEGAGGVPLGFVTVDPASGHVDQLAVARGRWGRGIARALMARAEARSPGGIELEVNIANRRAAEFYAREGFVSAGEALSAVSGLPIQRLRWTRADEADEG